MSLLSLQTLTRIAADGWQRGDLPTYLSFLGAGVMAIAAAGHALLTKKDSRSASAWVGLILLSPFVGAVLYFLFGINRIRRRAFFLRREASWSSDRAAPRHRPSLESFRNPHPSAGDLLLDGNSIQHIESFAKFSDAIIDGIQSATSSIALATYIFDGGEFGQRFTKPLASAMKRGVEVRVLIDAVGMRYSWPSAYGEIRRLGIPCARFLPTLVPWRWTYMNLRNHRKILVIDGLHAFTGGMNLRKLYLGGDSSIRDLHFSLKGPIVQQIQETFVADWAFATKEFLDGRRWFPDVSNQGSVKAHVVSDGPDEDFEKVRWILLAAIRRAKRNIRILTPYFIPDSSLVTALSVAAQAGVDVEIILPSANNLLLVHWASMAVLPQLLTRGCRVYFSDPPFDHAKLTVVDEDWVLFGSSNWDERSLRLNFELNLESLDTGFAGRMISLFEDRRKQSTEVSLAQCTQIGVSRRIRNGMCHLFAPYL